MSMTQILFLRGSRDQRQGILRQVILWWLVLGFPFSWHKAQLDKKVEWIGASIRIDPQQKVVAMGIPKEKTDKFLKAVWDAMASPVVPRKDLENMAGLVEWMAGILPQLKPFNTMLWAALGRKAKNIFSKQIAVTLEWFQAFAENRKIGNERIFRLTPPRFTIMVAFDASTTGGGAVMWQVPVERSPQAGNMATILSMCPTQYTFWRWELHHQQWAQARCHDSGSQARWEALALVLAVATWKDQLLANRGQWCFLGDPLGVLQGAVNFRSKDAAINRLFMELALMVVESGGELRAEHLWSEHNGIADELRRLHEGAALPEILHQVPQVVGGQPQWNIIPALSG